jgi:hypothetical protein
MGREEEGANFYSDLSQYGYSLIHPDRVTDPNELLVALSKSKDLRLLEGFPVVLANALEKDAERLNLAATEQRLKNRYICKRFHELVALSSSIFKVFGLEKLSQATCPKGFADEKRQAEIRDSVVNNGPLAIGKVELDVERVKNTFLRYYLHGREEKLAENKSKLREEFRQEFFLSLFFAPKQRDLLNKKLRGESLNKTESEYFSRVVKKKLMALVDPDLQRMALKVLQQT